MEGKDFRKLVGGLKVIKGPEGEEMNVVGDLYKFRNINNELRVLARASPEDKYILVTGLI
jgi:Ca2+ transporting ATPase